MTTATGPNFQYWNTVNPADFLKHDWDNPSRQWAATHAIAAAHVGDGSLLEVGPGSGVDYDRHFAAHVRAKTLHYSAFEGSAGLYDALRSRFPEAEWHNLPIADLPLLCADVVYARHVLEHQPALEPALGQLLAAARRAVVLTWYRPPGPKAFSEVWQGVDCRTYKRAEVEAGIQRAGFRIVDALTFVSGDEAWLLKRP